MLAYFQQRYPDIDVVLFEGTLQEVREWIFTNVIDAGFVLHHTQFTKGLESQLFLVDEMRVYVANTHRLHARTSVTFDDLSDERWIMRPSGCDMAEVFEHHQGGHHPHVYQASESGTVLAMVREEPGITILPCTMLPDRIEGIKCIPLDPPIVLPVGLVTKSAESTSPAAALFVQTAVAWAQEQGR